MVKEYLGSKYIGKNRLQNGMVIKYYIRDNYSVTEWVVNGEVMFFATEAKLPSRMKYKKKYSLWKKG